MVAGKITLLQMPNTILQIIISKLNSKSASPKCISKTNRSNVLIVNTLSGIEVL